MILPNKLYFAKPHTTFNIGEPILLELKGNVSIEIYGSQNEQSSVTELTVQDALITGDGELVLHSLPRYVAFIGTADRINVEGYDLKLIGDIS